jgi:hypothetical protein
VGALSLLSFASDADAKGGLFGGSGVSLGGLGGGLSGAWKQTGAGISNAAKQVGGGVSRTTQLASRGVSAAPKQVAGNISRAAKQAGRDHHPRCFTMWMAGGGSRPGTIYGETDDFSSNVVKVPVLVRDFHATVLHLPGFKHERFTFRYQGLDQRLTGVEKATMVKGLLA